MASIFDLNAWRAALGQSVANVGNAVLPGTDFGFSEAITGNNNPYGQVAHSTNQAHAGYSPAPTGGYSPVTASYNTGSTNTSPTGTTSTSSNTSSGTAPASSGPSVDQQLIDSAYNSRINDLNNQASTLQGQQNSILGDINSSADTSKGSLTSNYNLSNSNIDSQAQAGGQRQQDALTAARRLYQELTMGGQQRYGGASSAGEAYQALTGQELQRNSQQINSDYNTFMGQIAQAHQSVDAKYADATKQLESQRQLALNQAQRDFQDKMSQIASLKDQAAGDKASQQLSALQNLRNQIYNINLAVAQNNGTLNNLYSQQKAQLQQAEQALSQQAQGANSNQLSFAANASTNPQTSLTFGNNTPVTVAQPTGNKNDQILGMIAGQPINRNDLFQSNFATA